MVEIIANIYVKRAFNFTKFKTPDKGFSNDKYSFKIMGLEYEVAAIDSSLHNYEIVVASSNNSAVENISKELYQLHYLTG